MRGTPGLEPRPVAEGAGCPGMDGTRNLFIGAIVRKAVVEPLAEARQAIWTPIPNHGTITLWALTEEMKVGLEALVRSNRQEILQLAARHGVYRVRLFGSVARGEASADSDVDFLVDLEPGRSLFDLGGLLMDLQELLGCKVDVVTEKGLRPRIRDRVLSEAISL